MILLLGAWSLSSSYKRNKKNHRNRRIITNDQYYHYHQTSSHVPTATSTTTSISSNENIKTSSYPASYYAILELDRINLPYPMQYNNETYKDPKVICCTKECYICMESLIVVSKEYLSIDNNDDNNNDDLTRMPCGHVYHTNCINEWLNEHNTSPYCRYEIQPSYTAFCQSQNQQLNNTNKNSTNQLYHHNKNDDVSCTALYMKYELQRQQRMKIKYTKISMS